MSCETEHALGYTLQRVTGQKSSHPPCDISKITFHTLVGIGKGQSAVWATVYSMLIPGLLV